MVALYNLCASFSLDSSMLDKALTVALLSMSCLNASENILNESKDNIINKQQLNNIMDDSIEQQFEHNKNEYNKLNNKFNLLINNQDIISTSSDSDELSELLNEISSEKKQERSKHLKNKNKKQNKRLRNLNLKQQKIINNMKVYKFKQEDLLNNINNNKQKLNKIKGKIELKNNKLMQEDIVDNSKNEVNNNKEIENNKIQTQKNEQQSKNNNSWWNFGKNLISNTKNVIGNIGSGITNLVWNNKKENKVENKIELTSSIKKQDNNIKKEEIINNVEEKQSNWISWYKNIGNTVANSALNILNNNFVKQNILIPQAVHYGLTIGARLVLSPAQLIAFNTLKPAVEYAMNNFIIGKKNSIPVKENVAMYNEGDFVVIENNADNITKSKDKDDYKVIELKTDNQNKNSWKPFGNDNSYQKFGNVLMNNGAIPIAMHGSIEATKMLLNGPTKLILNLFQAPVEYALNNLVKSKATNIEDTVKQVINSKSIN